MSPRKLTPALLTSAHNPISRKRRKVEKKNNFETPKNKSEINFIFLFKFQRKNQALLILIEKKQANLR